MSKLLEQINKTKRKEVTLADIAIRIGDGLHGTPQYEDNGEFYFINGNNLDNGHISIKKETKRISESEYLKHKKDLGTETLLLSINGTIGNLAKYRGEKCILGKSACYINVKREFVLDYMYYVLLDQRFQKHIDSNANGSTIKNVSLGQLRDYTFYIPDFETQEKIASILNAYDSKIENNNIIIKNLELTAQTIFNEWFVNFKFPGYEKVKMIESEMGEIPEGWTIDSLDNICDISIGRTPPRQEQEWFSKNPKDIKWISIRDLGVGGIFISHTDECLTREAVNKFNIPIIPKGTLVVSFKLTMGKVAITTEEMLSNEAIAHLKIRDGSFISTEYLYLIMKSYNYDSLGSTSSIATAVNSKTIKNIKITVPEKEIFGEFIKKIKPLFQMMNVIQNESKNLKQSRDQLLAKLI